MSSSSPEGTPSVKSSSTANNKLNPNAAAWAPGAPPVSNLDDCLLPPGTGEEHNYNEDYNGSEYNVSHYTPSQYAGSYYGNGMPMYSNAAQPGMPLPPPPAAAFPGGKIPQTEEEWKKFNEEMQDRQKRLIEQQIEEKKAREAKLNGGGAASAAGTENNGKPYNPKLEHAPLTKNGNRRWPKNTPQKKVEASQKAAFESFANALLHTVSPYMAPLRQMTGSSLPHIKVDQRFGRRRGAPETAVMQFVISPVVVNYKPSHFHEVSPGDLLEFHHDFALVLERMSTANSIAVSYGPEWKPFALPYLYVGCRDYTQEVKRLCPNEVPNSRSEAVYEDDVVKDITELILAVSELAPLSNVSIIDAMKKRVNLIALYDVFDQLFEDIGDYQIQIRNLRNAPSQFLLKTSLQTLAKHCPLKVDVAARKKAIEDASLAASTPQQLQKANEMKEALHITANSYVVSIGGDNSLWEQLPIVHNTFQSGNTIVVKPIEAAAPIGLSVSKGTTPAEGTTPEKSTSTTAPQQQPPTTSKAVGGAAGSAAAKKNTTTPSASKPSWTTTALVCGACVAVTAGIIASIAKKK